MEETQAASWRSFLNKVLLKILQISQENGKHLYKFV